VGRVCVGVAKKPRRQAVPGTPHRCRFPPCEREFRLSGAREIHERVHTGARPHVCDMCEAAFKQLGQVQPDPYSDALLMMRLWRGGGDS